MLYILPQMYVADTLIRQILFELRKKLMTLKMMEKNKWLEEEAAWTTWRWKWREFPSDVSNYFPSRWGSTTRKSSAASLWEPQISQYKCFEYQKLTGRWPCTQHLTHSNLSVLIVRSAGGKRTEPLSFLSLLYVHVSPLQKINGI